MLIFINAKTNSMRLFSPLASGETLTNKQQQVFLIYFNHQGFTATTSISTLAPNGKAETAIAVLAG